MCPWTELPSQLPGVQGSMLVCTAGCCSSIYADTSGKSLATFMLAKTEKEEQPTEPSSSKSVVPNSEADCSLNIEI